MSHYQNELELRVEKLMEQNEALEKQYKEVLEAVDHFINSTGGQYNTFGQKAQLISKIKTITTKR